MVDYLQRQSLPVEKLLTKIVRSAAAATAARGLVCHRSHQIPETPGARTYGNGSGEMRVLLSTCGSRGDIEPMMGLAVQLRTLAAEVPVCAHPGFAELLARVGVPLAPVGRPVRPVVTGATSPSAADLPRRAGELVTAQLDTVAAVAEGCDSPVATGVMPTGVGR